jgi:hypothetical protein
VRRFGDAEIKQILQAAADLQERAQSLTSEPGRGLTLDELRQIAQEAGIDPRFVDLAVSDVDAPIERLESGLAGGPLTWRFRSDVVGEIGDDDRNRILQGIRSVMGARGQVADVYGRMEWSHDDGLGAVAVGVSSRGGTTEIDITASRSSEAALYHGLGIPFGGVLGGAALGALLGISGPAVVPLLVGGAGASYAALRLVWRARSRWWERRLRNVSNRLASLIQSAVIVPDADGGDGA